MAAAICRSVYRSNCRQFSSLLRYQLANTSVISNRGFRIFYRRVCFSQAFKVKNLDTEWKSKLTSEQYWVCRQKGTEPPWSGEYVDFKGKGTYKCVCCGSDLFSSSAKFDSGTGWPSFSAAVETCSSNDTGYSQCSVVEKRDDSHGMVRVEVLCRQCDSHLGHVFPDGPRPSGLRYCINSVSLKFQPDDST